MWGTADVPVTKYRSVADMPRPARVTDGASLLACIRAVWGRAARLAPPPVVPRGVARFRTIEEANAARSELTAQRMRQSIERSS
jgi:hypothetical protein